MSDRKAELERKRKKLEEIRRNRENRIEAGKAGKQTKESSQVGSDLDSKRYEVDQLLDGIDFSGIKSTITSKSSPQKPVDVSHSPQSVPSESPNRSFLRPVKLSVSTLNQTNIPPKEIVSYNKETQTPVAQKTTDSDEERTPSEVNKIENTEEKTQEPSKEEVEEVVKDKAPAVVELSDEQKEKILSSADFQSFLDRASRIIERAIFEKDVTFDYGQTEDVEGDNQMFDNIAVNREFYDEKWSRNRVVTSLDWSTQYPELLVSSYYKNEDAPREPDGVALIWNINYKKTTPEYIFHCQSGVMTTMFARFHPNLIVGGTYSGQIVLWDNRSNKQTPVQRTPLSAKAHTHPVYCVNVVGTQNAHNLISVSTNGKMCSWSLEMLSQPQESIELHDKTSKSIAVTSMSFLAGDVNNFVVGSEDGMVYTACRHGSKTGIIDSFEGNQTGHGSQGHQGPITGVDTHSAFGQIDFSQLFVTSSFDWTVKLWSHRSKQPLYSFENSGDYVYDVQWSPIHPAVFATVNGVGRLDLWNLNNDTEIPTASTTTEGSGSFSRCRWTQNGNHIVTGNDDGRVFFFDVGEQLATPRNDEWNRLKRTLYDLESSQVSKQPTDVTTPFSRLMSS
ncbi:cytoplasmic dynein 1 intermediate chain 2-like [Xenia sp. Carnegie-2017]|uniref:cytoplasmic dynein 1 intermediate chain 2-like n=1 Tax=Xenia sp. Carnegie-2017 TaxID=2897299 RepID=UPI001F04BF92|nr:cytoplasmic dynein 1 intermediate chain 2-like [Xenia sp. Carnegie-2017]